MNARQKRFCLEYAASGNATKAAEAAGYSKRTSRSQGQRLLTNVDIQAYLKEIEQEVLNEKIASIQDVQVFWTDIMTDETQKTTDRLKAAELLVRSKGGFASQPLDEYPQEDVVIYVPDNGMSAENEDKPESI